MIGGPAGLDALEVDALRTDRYLEALLSSAELGADDAPAGVELDPTLRSAARRLRDELVRVHPSFRFEERLGQRLAGAAARMRLAAAAGAGAEAPIIPFPGSLFDDPDLVAELANPDLAEFLAGGFAGDGNRIAESPQGSPGPDDSAGPGPTALQRDGAAAAAGHLTNPAVLRPAVSRQVLVGGALTSAALSLAGAAFVAWRLTRGAPSDPMARAVRAARAAREAGRVAGREAGRVAGSVAGAPALDLRPRLIGGRRPGRPT